MWDKNLSVVMTGCHILNGGKGKKDDEGNPLRKVWPWVAKEIEAMVRGQGKVDILSRTFKDMEGKGPLFFYIRPEDKRSTWWFFLPFFWKFQIFNLTLFIFSFKCCAILRPHPRAASDNFCHHHHHFHHTHTIWHSLLIRLYTF